jgi:DNA repair photolyase
MKIVEAGRDSIIEPCSLDLFTYQIDPYAGCAHHCVYCYTQNGAPVDWKTEVGLLPGLEARLEAELENISSQTVYMGMNTDPYQPAEREMRQSHKVLEILEGQGFQVCILTKSDLVLRDIEIIKRMPGSSVGFSVAFAVDDLRRVFEPDAPPLEARLEALARLKEAGVETYALIDPVIPHITEVGVVMDLLSPHADTIWVYPLHMDSRDDPNWRATRVVLEQAFPEALRDIERAAFDRSHAYWRSLREELRKAASCMPVRLEVHL